MISSRKTRLKIKRANTPNQTESTTLFNIIYIMQPLRYNICIIRSESGCSLESIEISRAAVCD